MIARGIVVAAMFAEPRRVPYVTLPRQVLARHSHVAVDDRRLLLAASDRRLATLTRMREA